MEVLIYPETEKQSQPLASLLRLLNKKKTAETLGVSTASVDRWASDPKNTFPAPLKIGPNRVAWTEKSIADWLELVAKNGGRS